MCGIDRRRPSKMKEQTGTCEEARYFRVVSGDVKKNQHRVETALELRNRLISFNEMESHKTVVNLRKTTESKSKQTHSNFDV